MKKPNLEKIMKGLGCTKEEAYEVWLADKAIDSSDEPLDFDLTEEQQKIAKSYTVTEKHKNTEKRARNVKINPTKQEFIAKLAQFLEKEGISATISSAEREISFDFDGKKSSLVLIQHGKSKKG